MGGRYRRVAANEDGLMVWGKSGKSQFFPFEKLDHVLDGERIFVAMFADQGVTIPKDTFIRGDAEQFGPFLKARINKKLRIETKKKKMRPRRLPPRPSGATRPTSPRTTRASSASRRRARRSARAERHCEGNLIPLQRRMRLPPTGPSSYLTSNLKSLRSGRSVIFIV